ncbi:hypothetical protein M9458_051112, partial [Cirrhinus mrigala]
HEEVSVWLFRDIVTKELKDELKDDDLIFITELIKGVDTSHEEWTATGRNVEKSFLYEIVVNQWNGIDVRKWDYFARDCHYLGISNSFDHQRMLNSARVCEVNMRNHICFRDKVADSIYDMFHTRYTLYLQAYQHKIVNIIEEKISKALLAAKDKSTKLSQAVESISEIKTRKDPKEVDENTRTNVLKKFIKLT